MLANFSEFLSGSEIRKKGHELNLTFEMFDRHLKINSGLDDVLSVLGDRRRA